MADRRDKSRDDPNPGGARGNSVGERRTPYTAVPADDDWVHELIAMTRPGVEIEFPFRSIEERPLPFVYDDFD